MAIIRVKKDRHYVTIDNAVLEDNRLSWEARGLLAYLLTKPDSWEVSAHHLVKQSPGGKAKVYRILGELESAGYLQKTQSRKAGQFASMSYDVHERPLTSEPFTENRDTVESVKNLPCTDLPYTEKPYPANRTLVNTDNSNNSPIAIVNQEDSNKFNFVDL